MAKAEALLKERNKGASEKLLAKIVEDYDAVAGRDADYDKARKEYAKVNRERAIAGAELILARRELAKMAEKTGIPPRDLTRRDSSANVEMDPTLRNSTRGVVGADEVFAKHHDKEGKAKPGWMKAPNGKPTNLGEKQWLAARTSSFKEAYGDWEKKAELRNAIEFVTNGEPVANLKGDEFAKTEENLIDRVAEFFAQKGGIAVHPELGEVIIDRRSAKSSIGHGVGRDKAAAFAAIPEVIRQGKIFNRQHNWKDRNVNSFVIAAPIEIGPTFHIRP